MKYASGLFSTPTAVRLTAANGQNIPCYGETSAEIAIKTLRRAFRWSFVVAETTYPLLGADFLSHFGILVDCKNCTIIDSSTNRKLQGKVTESSIQQISINNLDHVPTEVKDLFQKHPSLLTPRTTDLTRTTSNVKHCIDTSDATPTYAKVRQLSVEKFEIAKKEFTALLQAGIIRQSKSPWTSPLHLVPQETPGKFRICGDYRTLNARTKPDRYPIPHIHSVGSKLKDQTVFSKIDLLKAYHQIPMREEDIEKTAVITPFGLFEYVFMPFGLRNAGSTFQRFMDNLFLNVSCVFNYLDDVLIFSPSMEQHIKDLDVVMGILEENNLKLSINKCEFFRNSLDYLGYNISNKGVTATSAKIAEIDNFPQPTDSKSLRRFLGMVGFYRRLIPHFADIVLPLTELIKHNPNAKSLEFSEASITAFEEIKSKLANITALPHPSSNATHYHIVSDSSNYAIGAALHQIQEETPVPFSFFSKKLSSTQQKASTFDRELLAAYLAVLHFKPLIEGRHVTLFTDHRPLTSAFKKSSTLKSDKQQRYMSLISEYVVDILYIRGQENIVADCLSRPANAVTVDLFDLPALSEQQKVDEEIKNYTDKLRVYSIGDAQILCDISTPSPRPFVPQTSRRAIFDLFHNLSHSGTSATTKMIKNRYFWPGMDKNIREMVKACEKCQQSKIHRHTKSEITHFNLLSSRFETVHIDIVGPLPPATQENSTYPAPYRYFLTCIDRATRWVEAIPMSDITASTVAISFLNAWVSRFGVPLYVLTDRGTQFESELFKELSTLVGFHRLRTCAYRPQTNGIIERQHRTIKSAIMARKQNWLTALPIVLLGLRNIPNEDGYSPSLAVTGTSFLLPRQMLDTETQLEFTSDKVRKLATEMYKLDMQKLSQSFLHSIPKDYVPKDLKKCSHVWLRVDRVRRPLEAPYSGPFKVVSRHSKYFTIELPNGHPSNVSIDRLKPVHNSSSPKNNKTTHQSGNDIETEEPIESPLDDVTANSEESPRPAPAQADSYTTRSGRRVHFNPNHDFYYF